VLIGDAIRWVTKNLSTEKLERRAQRSSAGSKQPETNLNSSEWRSRHRSERHGPALRGDALRPEK
jgi:hypothetical protein